MLLRQCRALLKTQNIRDHDGSSFSELSLQISTVFDVVHAEMMRVHRVNSVCDDKR